MCTCTYTRARARARARVCVCVCVCVTGKRGLYHLERAKESLVYGVHGEVVRRGFVFIFALIPRETIPTELLRFFFSLSERTLSFSLVLLASGDTGRSSFLLSASHI